MSEPKHVKKRPRTVFGKNRITVHGIDFVVRMTKTNLEVHRLHARKYHSLPLDKMVMLVLVNAPLK